ncbi:MAG: hypothetical protein K2X35_15455 [Bryobacteraceae bacterium]|nr:hypothetical protein [Bryobacteraceae bacterium]
MIRDEARKARERLARAVAAMSSVEEAEELSKKKNELRDLAAKVGVLVGRRGMLWQGGVPLSQPPDVERAIQSCRMMLTRFAESPKASTLVDKQRWTKVVSSVAEFNAVEETQQKQDWKEYYSTKLFGGVPPEQREQTILMTLRENQGALELYKRLYKRLSLYRATVPSTVLELNEAHENSRQLSEIRFVENHDVPSAVRIFFNATSSGGGADLKLLTTEVLDWLHANGMLNNFAVRAR